VRGVCKHCNGPNGATTMTLTLDIVQHEYVVHKKVVVTNFFINTLFDFIYLFGRQ